MENARKPHFLEVFLPALCSERLEIPTRFTKHLPSTTSESVLLKGPSDNSWHVDLIEHNGHLFFDYGWPIFVKDHFIQCGDSLVFRYDGNSHFTVQIFDQTSCEKEEAFQAKCSSTSCDVDGFLEGKKETGREASISNLSIEKKFKGALVPFHLDFPNIVGDQNLEMCCNEDHEINEFVMNEYDNRMLASTKGSEKLIVLGLPFFSNSQEMIQSQRMKNASKFKRGCSASKAKIDFSVLKVEKACMKKNKKKTKNSISEFVEEKAAHYFSSSFPYFVRAMKYSNINKGTLNIPAKFSKLHLPNHRTTVVVRNLDGDCWVLNTVPTTKLNHTKISFCKGWSAFVRCNSIKVEDVCIFELVDKFEMRVHILRLGVEGMESQTRKCRSDAYGDEGGGPTLRVAENIEEDDELHLKTFEQSDDLNIIGEEDHEKDLDMNPGTEYSIGTSDSGGALCSPLNYDPSPLSVVSMKVTGNDDGTISHPLDIKSEGELCTTPSMNTWLVSGDERAVQSFTSPFPSFRKVIMSSNVHESQTLAVPRKFYVEHLQTLKNEIVLRNKRGECWNVTCTHYGYQTVFNRGWPLFVHHNGVKPGDICIFELIDDKVFQVHIFETSPKGQMCLLGDDVDYDDQLTIETTQCSYFSET